jgi:hypothetical protein
LQSCAAEHCWLPANQSKDFHIHDELVEYRGFFIFWRKPLNSGKWTANITSGSPSLFPAIEPSRAGAIDGHSRDDMLPSCISTG